MLATSKKGEAVTEENGYRHRLRNKKAIPQNADRPYGVNWNAMAERTEYYPGEKNRTFKGCTTKRIPLGTYQNARAQQKPRFVGLQNGDKSATTTDSNLSNYRIQINKFLESLEEYKKFELSLKDAHDALVNMRMDLLSSTEIEPDKVPDVQSSIQDILGIPEKKIDSEDNSRPTVSDKESRDIHDNLLAKEEENKKLQESLAEMRSQLKTKDEELSRLNGALFSRLLNRGEGDIDETEGLRQTIAKLERDNRMMAETLQRLRGEKSESENELHKKIKSLEKLIESLHVEIKKLKDQLKLEKETKNMLETENSKLLQEINDLKTLASSSDSKYIILEKDAKIQDLQKRLMEISRIRPHHSTNQCEVFKVDFSADTPSLVNQLANFVQLYEELSREGFDLESKLKDAHVEIYRLEQILEKQLIKIKEQDECLKNMEESLSKVVLESRKNSGLNLDNSPSTKCQCDEFQMMIKQKEEFSEKLKEKMSLLYQKYKQYKTECNLMKKKIDSIEKRSWLKKLVNI